MPLFLPQFDLQAHNTLAVPATARYYVKVLTEQELREALAFAAQENLPLLILGSGSNIVLRDDFPGLALHISMQGKWLLNEDDDFIWLRVAAGENWHGLVEYCLGNHYWGLENLSLIPGSVGAAPVQNIGAYGVELKDVFAELSAVEIRSGITIVFTKEACEFGYRDSAFKNHLRDQYVITSVTFKLRKQPDLQLSYPALREALGQMDTITPLEVSRVVCNIRRGKLPDPAQIPNVGSFFKNPVITLAHYCKLRLRFPDLVSYPVDDTSIKVAAGWLIDRAGWRGYSEGAVAVHAQQALVLTNAGGAKGSEILALARKIQNSVRAEYGIDLEPEPRVYPEHQSIEQMH